MQENQYALGKILDLTRMLAIVLLGLHFYYYGYTAFAGWQLVSDFSDRLLENVARTGLFARFHRSKVLALGLLLVSLLGIKGKKKENLPVWTGLGYTLTGMAIYFAASLLWYLPLSAQGVTVAYLAVTTVGFVLVLMGGTLLSRVITVRLEEDVFNRQNETFPQEERYLDNAFSINLPARYRLRNQTRKSWINVINPFRGLLVLGSPGAGKSYFVIRHVITQHLSKAFTMFVYDFKIPDLSVVAYNAFLRYRHRYAKPPAFYTIHFDDLSRSHRCNPLEAEGMLDLTDAAESSRTILLGLNREWIRRQGDFFVESAINFLTAVIWFLRKFGHGRYCTLPHAIELMQLEYGKLFTILRAEKEIEVLINPFVTAYRNGAMEQLEGQVASAKIALARLSSPQLYYVLSGRDFTLDINNPDQPKIVCMGNNPQKSQIYGAVLSLYVNRLVKLVNQKGKAKCSLVLDEFPTIYLNHIDGLLATARSNQVATTLGLQDFSQLRKDYGREQAEVIMNITGNLIAGQVTGDTAKQLSERLGKVMQDRTSLSVNRTDTSVSKSKQYDYAIPASRMATLSSGEFVGLVADNPDQKIDRKAFHGAIVNDHRALKREEAAYQPLPVIRPVDDAQVQANYLRIKEEIQDLVDSELERILQDPGLAHLVVK
ncbi:conjugal transfer protein MobC [Rhabdobacter roseus]|uniref:YWFCY domain-containing protein n=1 Tax=Rhabdobacter roseus TaxID=1655419 RepID=A0A840TN59_9BACT|nr:conjugal transfer protein MobC [Rhabdobacter roseus]MBB5282982.1 hypothetical protein [Rhabdobacter roseus]